jgi:hypothetical protein
MPKRIIESMKRGGVDNPYALLNAAGYKEGDSEKTTKSKLSRFQKRKKKKGTITGMLKKRFSGR